MRYQRGMTFIGLLCILALVGLIGYAGLRLVPLYLNYMKVSRALEQLATENAGDEQANSQASAQAMRTSLTKRFDIDSIDFPPIESIAFSRDGKSWVARAKYEDEVPLFGNLSLLIKFDKSVALK